MLEAVLALSALYLVLGSLLWLLWNSTGWSGLKAPPSFIVFWLPFTAWWMAQVLKGGE